MIDPKDHLAETLKTVRKAKGLSLDKAAVQTGVSKAMLGQIERGESSPTVSTLWKISTGLGVSLSTFIEPLPGNKLRETTLRNADDIRQHPADGGLLISPLFPFDPQLGFEYMELSFEDGYERMSEPHSPGVMEVMTSIEGEMEVFASGKWNKLPQGQSIRFAGDREHGYRNRSGALAKTITVIHYHHRTE